MKTNMKLVIVLMCAVVIVASSVMGTLAYLTDDADVVNTFTVGNVSIKLDEAVVDSNGDPVDPEQRTEEGNKYHLIPGGTYKKDPTVTMEAGSEASYVRMLLTVVDSDAVDAIIANPAHQLTDYAGLFAGWDNAFWLYQGFTKGTEGEKNTITFEFWYYGIAAETEEDMPLPALFQEIKIPVTLNNDEIASLKDVQVKVTAHAIQAAGFADATAAWAAFAAQTAGTTTPETTPETTVPATTDFGGDE